MDEIINDRDVWLQTFKDRFTKVTVQPGSAVSNAQTSALSVSIAAAKRLDLNAPLQYFIVRSDPV